MSRPRPHGVNHGHRRPAEAGSGHLDFIALGIEKSKEKSETDEDSRMEALQVCCYVHLIEH